MIRHYGEQTQQHHSIRTRYWKTPVDDGELAEKRLSELCSPDGVQGRSEDVDSGAQISPKTSYVQSAKILGKSSESGEADKLLEIWFMVSISTPFRWKSASNLIAVNVQFPSGSAEAEPMMKGFETESSIN